MRILDSKKYSEILKICALREEVRKEVIRNYNNNLWWPLSIKDWRSRLLIAGLSARVSYRMIKKYQQVVEKIRKYKYEDIASMSVEDFVSVVKPLGLVNSRVRFWRSVKDFVKEVEKERLDIRSLSNDELIALIRNRVKGVDYHLAQCCALYIRGYHCGIIPVDSGMVKTLAPCFGFPLPKGSRAYEVLRKELEELTTKIDCRKIAITTGYSSLNLPKEKSLTWWMHLVLIYFKRAFCNKRHPEVCPLLNSPQIKEYMGQMCTKNNPKLGGVKIIVLEGIDGVGKTTMAEMLSKIGFNRFHARYHLELEDLYPFYNDLLKKSNGTQRIVFDRTFISEMVYGPILRKKTRFSLSQFEDLLTKLKEQRGVLIYLYAPLEILVRRDKKLPHEVRQHYSQLIEKYKEIIAIAENYVPVIRINSGENDPNQIFHLIFGIESPAALSS